MSKVFGHPESFSWSSVLDVSLLGELPGKSRQRFAVAVSTQPDPDLPWAVSTAVADRSIAVMVLATEKRIRLLEERLERLEEAAAPRVLVVLPMRKRKAKSALVRYFREHPGHYPSDAAIALQIDPEVANELTIELLSEGRLEAEG